MPRIWRAEGPLQIRAALDDRETMGTTKPRIGLLGYGYWGPNLLRNLVSNANTAVVGLVEPDPAARARAARTYPHVPVFEDLDKFLSQVKPDGVVIATPPATHKDLAVRCLRAGAHVLVEKPLAVSVAECDEILTAAKQAKRQVMVDHTFVYNPAVEYLADRIRKGELGDLMYYDSVRVNLGGFQKHVNALWDLAPHDLSILDLFLKGKTPVSVAATGVKQFGASVESLCYLHLAYENSFTAHLHLNWVAPVKIRTVMVGGSKKMAVYDENLPSEKIKLYDSGVDVSTESPTPGEFRVSYRMGDMMAPAIPTREALAGVVSDFVECVQTGRAPVSDGKSGRRMVEILEAASLSLKHGGEPIRLPLARPNIRVA